MRSKELRKIKLFFKSEKNILKISDFENLIEKNNNLDEKNFFRGCKHILEKHYTEAIKWFQLSDSFNESILLILFCSLKVGDKFLFDEYFSNDFEDNFKLFNKYNFYPFVDIKGENKKLDIQLLQELKEKYL